MMPKMTINYRWTTQEINKLKQLRTEQNQKNMNDWNIISQEMFRIFPHIMRTSKQCRQKYVNSPCPSFDDSQNQWSDQEFEYLRECYILHGPRWAQISKYFPNKSQNNIKNKFNNRIRKSASLLNEIEGEIYKNTKKTIDYGLIVKIISFINELEKCIRESGSIINLKNRFFQFRSVILRLSFTKQFFDHDKLIQMVKQIKSLNRDIRSYGVFKAKNIKNWKLQKINFDKICQKQEVMINLSTESASIQDQSPFESRIYGENTPKDNQQSTKYEIMDSILQDKDDNIFESMIRVQESIFNLDDLLYF